MLYPLLFLSLACVDSQDVARETIVLNHSVCRAMDFVHSLSLSKNSHGHGHGPGQGHGRSCGDVDSVAEGSASSVADMTTNDSISTSHTRGTGDTAFTAAAAFAADRDHRRVVGDQHGARGALVAALVAELSAALREAMKDDSAPPAMASLNFHVAIADDNSFSIKAGPDPGPGPGPGPGPAVRPPGMTHSEAAEIGLVAAATDALEYASSDACEPAVTAAVGSATGVHDDCLRSESLESTGLSDAGQDQPTLEKTLMEILVNHILLAASRTTAGGDAFFVLEDLYGGEGLILSPRPYRARKQLAVHFNLPTAAGTAAETNQAPPGPAGAAMKGVDLGASSIRIVVAPAGVTVSVKEQYDLFLQDSVEVNMEASVPLISFECTTKTLISFRPTDVIGSGGGGSSNSSSSSSSSSNSSSSISSSSSGSSESNKSSSSSSSSRSGRSNAGGDGGSGSRSGSRSPQTRLADAGGNASPPLPAPAPTTVNRGDLLLKSLHDKLVYATDKICRRAVSIEPFFATKQHH